MSQSTQEGSSGSTDVDIIAMARKVDKHLRSDRKSRAKEAAFGTIHRILSDGTDFSIEPYNPLPQPLDAHSLGIDAVVQNQIAEQSRRALQTMSEAAWTARNSPKLEIEMTCLRDAAKALIQVALANALIIDEDFTTEEDLEEDAKVNVATSQVWRNWCNATLRAEPQAGPSALGSVYELRSKLRDSTSGINHSTDRLRMLASGGTEVAEVLGILAGRQDQMNLSKSLKVAGAAFARCFPSWNSRELHLCTMDDEKLSILLNAWDVLTYEPPQRPSVAQTRSQADSMYF